MKGKFISVEGGDGSGKTTSIAHIKSRLISCGIQVIETREPGGTEMAEEIRSLLLRPRDESVSEMAELLLMFASRAQHIYSLIQPALDAGKWVLSDRFTDATFAYQGGGRGIPMQWITTLEIMVQQTLRPDLTFLLDLPVEMGLERARKRSDLDRFEVEQLNFFKAVRRVYLQRAANEPNRFAIIDAAPSITNVQCQIDRAIEQRLGLVIS